MAGRQGFEPWVDLNGPQTLSRRPHSTTLAPSRAGAFRSTIESSHAATIVARRNAGMILPEHFPSQTRLTTTTTAAPHDAEPIDRVWAEREGFEPPVLSHNCFQDSRLKPLGHLSSAARSGKYSIASLSSRAAAKDLPALTPHEFDAGRSFAAAQDDRGRDAYSHREIRSIPPMYGLMTSGITTEPSSCWLFSMTAASVRGMPSPEPLRVWTNWTRAPSAGR